MVPQINVYLFGEQSEDVIAGLQNLIYSDEDPILSAFFTQSFSAIRSELAQVPKAQRQPIPRISNLLDLLTLRCDDNNLLVPHYHVPLSHALTTIYQIGSFIRHCLRYAMYPSPNDSYLAGICTGSLTAAAISCCRTLSELLPVAVQIVKISFCAGLLARDVSRRLEPISKNDATWAMIFPAWSVVEAIVAIEEFSLAHRIPVASRPYVSSSSNRGITISGPPNVLKVFRSAPNVQNIKAISIPILALYHARHLYTLEDINNLLNAENILDGVLSQKVPIICSDNEQIAPTFSLRDALHNALKEIFLQPIQWDTCTKELARILQFPEAATASKIVVPIATGAAPGLRVALKQNGVNNIEVSDHSEAARQVQSALGGSGFGSSRSKIAIIGMSGRFPNANSTEAFWELLHAGLDVVKVVPSLRWDAATHVDRSEHQPGKNTSATPFGCWLDEPGLFDARFFGMSPREALQVDPAQRLALLTAFEAMEKAGMVPDRTPSTRRDRVGVFFGVTSNDWMETNSAQDIDTFFIPGGNRAFIPGRINYCYKYSGPSYSVDTACSSSLAAIHIACNFLWQGDVDTAIAGGTNVLTNPDFTSGLDRGHFLSRTGNCKTFDDTADGYCRGEGVVSMVLKRLEDALADNDPIQGVIVNACTNHSAESDSITRPHIGAQTSIFHNVLAGINPADVSYIEMHGTGTQTGDSIEMASVLATFAPDIGPNQRPKNQPVFLGSAKANVGHGEAVSGVTSLAKVLLMMQYDIIPPHCGIKTQINRKFPTNLSTRGVHIADRPLSWERSRGVRSALVNNFSAAGGNTALLIEDAPSREIEKGQDTRETHIVTVSAKSASALEANSQALVKFLHDPHVNSLSLPSLSYTTTARRLHHPHRVAVSGSTTEEIRRSLVTAIENHIGKVRAEAVPAVVFTFTGQGSSYMKMAKELFESITTFQTDIRRYDQLIQVQGFPSILPIICGIKDNGMSFANQLPIVTQLATTCLQMALVRLWASWGIVPRTVLGHSLGHYAALNAAGVLSDADTIFLVGMRAQLLQDRCQTETHSMLAVRSSISNLKHFLSDIPVEIACINGPDDVVLAGVHEEIECIHRVLAEQKIRTTKLKVWHAFHSRQMDCILEEFEFETRGVTFHPPSLPIICPVTSTVIRKHGVIGPKYLAAHCRNVVDIVGALEAAEKNRLVGSNVIILEIGPHPVVCGMVKSILKTQCTTASSLMRDANPWKTLTATLSALYMAGAEIFWDEYHRDFSSFHQVLSLPAYNWDLKDYWIKYVNDWSLRKGDPPLERVPTDRIPSTTIHKIVNEEVDHEMGGSITLESDIHRSDLYPLVQGHKVNGIPLCTPSVYADIALSVGTYFHEKYRPTNDERQLDIGEMTIQNALIAQPEGPQLLRSVVKIDWKKKKAICYFSSVKISGERIVDHASCSIKFLKFPEQSRLNAQGIEYRAKIKELKMGLANDKCYKFNKPMVYRMVETLAEFDADYRAINEIVLDSDAMAAVGKMNFADVKRTERKFNTHPAYIDAFSQLAGFVVNANDSSDTSIEVYVNHGWGSLQLYEPILPNQLYETYVQMVKSHGTIWKGSVMILDGEKLVGKFEDIELQGVPKRLLHSILSSANKEQSQGRATSNLATSISTSNHKFTRANTTLMREPNELSLTRISQPQATDNEGLQVAITKALEIIAEESGVDIDELRDDVKFATIGIDSLLSLIITSRLKDELEFESGSGFSVFDDFSTVGDLKEGLVRSKGTGFLRNASIGFSTTSSETTPTTGGSTPSFKASAPETSIRPCTSVILQGSLQSRGQRLFLFPDGSGSAQSYMGISQINEALTVVGLICPYMRDPENMTCELDDLTDSYISEIQRRQPHGPYTLGGWSAGGILAYHATVRLLDQGEKVQHLVLIDSPEPKGMDRLPPRFYDHCRATGIFKQIGRRQAEDNGDGKQEIASPPKWLIPHFNATIDLLAKYHAQPLPWAHRHLAPQVSICWASECVFDGVKFPKLPKTGGGDAGGDVDDEPVGMKFLTEKRSDFSAGGWAELFHTPVNVERAEKANHFSMMHGEYGVALSRFIDKATRVTGHLPII